MLETIDRLESAFSRSRNMDEALDVAVDFITDLGFAYFVYDYSPVALAPDGSLNRPTYVSMRNEPREMMDLWTRGGFYENDPIQQMSIRTTRPFVYSCSAENNPTVLANTINKNHSTVVAYLHEVQMTCGISVPIQRARGDLATCTAVWHGDTSEFWPNAERNRILIGLMGPLFHENAFRYLGKQERQIDISLTPRERECLRYSAEGLTAKEIARQLDRSTPTVIMHLQSAMHKLGAKNRLHAAVLAYHYRLLEL